MRALPASRRSTASKSQKTWLHSLIQSSPARFALLVFTGLILVWTALLSLPIATRSGEMTPLADSLFTAVSAICVTGLSTVNMAAHWSLFGDLVILTGLQIGGIGVLTLASILGATVTRRLGLRTRLLAASDTNPARNSKGSSESQAVGLGEMGGLLAAVAALAGGLPFAREAGFGLALRLRGAGGIVAAAAGFALGVFELLGAGHRGVVEQRFVPQAGAGQCGFGRCPLRDGFGLGGLGFLQRRAAVVQLAAGVVEAGLRAAQLARLAPGLDVLGRGHLARGLCGGGGT